MSTELARLPMSWRTRRLADRRPGRRAAVLDLVELRRPIQTALANLPELDSDPEYGSVTLKAADVVRALNCFDSGWLDDDALSAWAEAVHGLEDVTLDPTDRDLLADALFELSTPELFGAMTDIVAALRARFQTVARSDEA